METVQELTLSQNDIKFCATIETGETVGFALTPDYENNSVNFYTLDMETFENFSAGVFEFGDEEVDLLQKIETITAMLKERAGSSVITVQ
jgi:hypothetical protein